MFKEYEKIGFTLMEVLVALVILSIAFITIFMGISRNANNLLHLQGKTAANWVAQNVIAEAELHEISIQNGKVSEDEQMFDKIWHWTAVITPTGNPYVSRIEVSVKPKNSDSNIIHLISYLRNES